MYFKVAPNNAAAYAPCNQLNVEGLHLLLQADLQYLVKLSLGLNHFDGSALQLLVRGKWPRLEYLDISYNKLCDIGVDWSQAIWPTLRHLNVKCVFDPLNVLSGIGEAKWPLLRTLDVSWARFLQPGGGHGFSAAFEKEVVKGKWPLLECLYAQDYLIRTFDVQAMLQAAWPSLK